MPTAQRTVTANGLEFACLTDGPDDGPLALCLHGFPDTAHTWRYLLPELAAASSAANANEGAAITAPIVSKTVEFLANFIKVKSIRCRSTLRAI